MSDGKGSLMASEQDRQELKDKVAALVQARFGGDYWSAFQHYDGDQDGKIVAEIIVEQINSSLFSCTIGCTE